MTQHTSVSATPTKHELEKARTKGQVLGWVQGAGAVFVVGVVLRFVGWIPLIALGAVGAYFVYRVLFGGTMK